MDAFDDFRQRWQHCETTGFGLNGSEFAGGGFFSKTKAALLGAGRAAAQAAKHVYHQIKPIFGPILGAAANRAIDHAEHALFTGLERGNFKNLPNSVLKAAQQSVNRDELRRQLVGGLQGAVAGRPRF